jgi:signal transduction histidine kinase
MKTYPIIEGRKIEFLTGIIEDDSARKSSLLNMQKINGWKDSILEILAHDLRGPIGMVKMLASAIDQQLDGNKNQQIRKWTKMIQEISIRNIRLIHALVKKESLDTEKVVLSKEAIDLVWEIGEVMKIYIDSQKDASKQFQFTYSHQPIFARVDSMKFLQIINNLISNSIKFTGPEGSIKVHLEKLENSALITVSDDGIGIPKSLQPLLFKKYTEAGRTGLDGQESIGLGMWIVKSFTDAHGGRIWFESVEGSGTTINVEIPLGYHEYEQDTLSGVNSSKIS